MYLIIFLIILIFIFIVLNKHSSNENYINPIKKKNCNVPKRYKSFCAWNHNSNKCQCAFQKGRANIYFPSEPDCCTRKCNMLSKTNCQLVDNTKKLHYWCPVAGKCEKFPAYINANVISGNECGFDKLTNQKIFPFLNEKDCKKSIDPCDQYNNENYSDNEKKNKCLSNDFCGWCTNSQGIGRCVSGTESGPINIYKYNFCRPNTIGNINSYTHRKKMVF